MSSYYDVQLNPYYNTQQTGYASNLGLTSTPTGYSEPINMVSTGSSTASLDPYAMYLSQQGQYDALASAYPSYSNSSYNNSYNSSSAFPSSKPATSPICQTRLPR